MGRAVHGHGDEMPEDFLRCAKNGGRVRTIHPKGRPDVNIKVCYKGGKSTHGEPEHRGGSKRGRGHSADGKRGTKKAKNKL